MKTGREISHRELKTEAGLFFMMIYFPLFSSALCFHPSAVLCAKSAFPFPIPLFLL